MCGITPTASVAHRRAENTSGRTMPAAAISGAARPATAPACGSHQASRHATTTPKHSCARQAWAMASALGSTSFTSSAAQQPPAPAPSPPPATPARAASQIASTIRQHRDRRGQHPVAELKANAAFQRRHQLAVGERPVGNRQSRVVAGDQPAGDHQQQGTKRTTTEKRRSHRFTIGYRCIRTGQASQNLPLIPYPLNAKSAVLLSLAPTVTCWSCVPYFSCQASMV